MVVKTFNVDEQTYALFSEYCKDLGISMSKQINTFMQSQIEEDREVREEYLEKLDKIRKGPFIRVEGRLRDRYEKPSKKV
jgi:antitoxin component of RelBE/YafQ-DinJ toxin-antitoxin module